MRGRCRWDGRKTNTTRAVSPPRGRQALALFSFAVRVLRALDEAGLLGDGLFVIGTNALYAYEMQSGVLFDSALVATGDFDLPWDARHRLRLAISRLSPGGVLGLLKEADATYSSADDYGFRARNADGYYVDLFCSEAEPPRARLAEGDIDPIPTAGGNWLAAAPKTEAVVIGQDGLPARMVCVDPRIGFTNGGFRNSGAVRRLAARATRSKRMSWRPSARSS